MDKACQSIRKNMYPQTSKDETSETTLRILFRRFFSAFVVPVVTITFYILCQIIYKYLPIKVIKSEEQIKASVRQNEGLLCRL